MSVPAAVPPPPPSPAAGRVRERRMGKSTRDAYGEVLLELGQERRDIVVLDADLSKSTKTGKFAAAFPERFFNCGIAEANMVSIACGLAATGKTVFASSFAVFLLCKAFDQMRMGIAYSGFPVKLVSSHGGISIGEDGPSQASVEDLALALSLPDVAVCVPADETAARALVRAACLHKGAVYIRTGRPAAPIVHPAGSKIELGRAVTLEEGRDLTIVACGLLVAEALEAHDLLAAEGIQARVLDVHTLRPLDREALLAAARETGALVVAEEHLKHGGLGSVVASELALGHPAPIELVGLDGYAESGKPAELMERYGLTARHIVAAARRVLARKK